MCLNHPELVHKYPTHLAISGTSSGLLKHIEPHRTYTKHTSTEIARCVGFLCTSAGWFKNIKPHRTYTNHTITKIARCVGCLCTRSGWFKHSEPHRTSRNSPAQREQGVLWWCVSCRFDEVRCASTTPNYHTHLIEPTRTTPSES